MSKIFGILLYSPTFYFAVFSYFKLFSPSVLLMSFLFQRLNHVLKAQVYTDLPLSEHSKVPPSMSSANLNSFCIKKFLHECSKS